MAWLATRGEEYAHAFENPKVIRAAIDRAHVQAANPDQRGRRNRLFPADDGGLASRARARYIIPMTALSTVRLQREPFDAAAEAASLSRGRTDVGALVTFTGICRGEEAGEPIAALTLEHYPGMAEAEIERHVAEAPARWPLIGVTVIHRYGRIRRARTS